MFLVVVGKVLVVEVDDVVEELDEVEEVVEEVVDVVVDVVVEDVVEEVEDVVDGVAVEEVELSDGEDGVDEEGRVEGTDEIVEDSGVNFGDVLAEAGLDVVFSTVVERDEDDFVVDETSDCVGDDLDASVEVTGGLVIFDDDESVTGEPDVELAYVDCCEDDKEVSVEESVVEVNLVDENVVENEEIGDDDVDNTELVVKGSVEVDTIFVEEEERVELSVAEEIDCVVDESTKVVDSLDREDETEGMSEAVETDVL